MEEKGGGNRLDIYRKRMERNSKGHIGRTGTEISVGEENSKTWTRIGRKRRNGERQEEGKQRGKGKKWTEGGRDEREWYG